MKRFFAGILTVSVLLAAMLSGCGGGHGKVSSFGDTDKGIYVYHDLCVEDCVYTDFDTKKYDAEEYRGYLQAELDEYNNSHEFFAPETEYDKDGNPMAPRVTVPIAIVKCEAKNNELCERRIFATAQDFTDYLKQEIEARGGNTLQTGRLSNVDPSLLTTDFTDEKGNAVDVSGLVSDADAGDYFYAICNFESVLYGDGDIIGFSTGLEFVKSAYCVKVPAGTTGIVIFKYKK